MLRHYIAVALSCLFFQSVSYAEADINSTCSKQNCAIIIDAGSSGSRVHVYAFDQDESQQPANLTELTTKKITPGIADLRPNDVPGYLEKLMQDIPVDIDFPIHFYATAGMRLLSKEQQQEIYKAAKDWYDTHSNWHINELRTISGIEEGVYGWMGLYSKLDKSFKTESMPGFIEIGGASTQVVFPVSNFSQIDASNLVVLKLNDKSVILFVNSFLGLGANEVTKRFTNNSACFPVGYKLANGEVAVGDALNCEANIMSDINADNSISNIVKTAQLNNPTQAWYTTGAVSSIAQKEPFDIKVNYFSAQLLLDKANSIYCHQDWDTLQYNYASNDKYLHQNCLMSSYFFGLIKAYGLDTEQNFTINNFSDWTEGALLLYKAAEHHS